MCAKFERFQYIFGFYHNFLFRTMNLSNYSWISVEFFILDGCWFLTYFSINISSQRFYTFLKKIFQIVIPKCLIKNTKIVSWILTNLAIFENNNEKVIHFFNHKFRWNMLLSLYQFSQIYKLFPKNVIMNLSSHDNSLK